MRNPTVPNLRDPRLDFFRGLSLAMIFINHVPGTVFEDFTSRNFGFSDAAEGFVFMSGAAAALAYGPGLAQMPRWPTVSRIWGRSWLLYLVHLMTALWAIGIVSAAALWFGAEIMLTKNAFKPLTEEPLAFLIGIVTLGHQLGYVNILPMYAALLLAAPFLIRMGQVRPGWLLLGSLGFWALTGTFRINLPNYPFEGGWFFNPFAWQILFTLGILTGLALRNGRRFVPQNRWLFWAAVGWLLFCLVWVKSDGMLKGLGHGIWQLRQWGAPFWLVDFDKTFVSGPRLLHIMALAYVLSMPGLVPRIAASTAAAPLRLLGRHGLPVFALGTVLAILGQAIKAVHPAGMAQDAVLIFGGLAVQWAFAAARERLSPKAAARRAAAATAVTSTTAPLPSGRHAPERWVAKPAR